jgi:hypothetical protein
MSSGVAPSPRTLPQPFLAAVAASLLLHIALGWALYKASPRWGSAGSQFEVSSTLFIPPSGVLFDNPAASPEFVAPPDPDSSQPEPTEPVRTNPVDTEPEKASPQREFPVEPGVDDSSAQSPNWLGAAVATPHSAPLSSVDQPALSRDPGQRGPHTETSSNAGSTEVTNADGEAAAAIAGDALRKGEEGESDAQTTSAQATSTVPPVARPEPPAAANTPDARQETPAPDLPPQTKPAPEERLKAEQPLMPPQASPATSEVSKPEDETGLLPPPKLPPQSPTERTAPTLVPPRELKEGAQPAEPEPPEVNPPPTTPTEVPNVPVAAEVVPPSPRAPAVPAGGATVGAATPAPAAAGSQNKVPGQTSDSESPATSREMSVTFTPGTPLAREGLRVRTVLPQFTTTTRTVTRPKQNPLIIIHFNRAGKVVKAEYAQGRTTGTPALDGPLLDSIYQWSARGKKLQELPANDPSAVFVMRMEYLFE